MFRMKLILLFTLFGCNNGLQRITLDGTQFITSSLITKPLHTQRNELGINFQTTLSSCLLFFASGVSGDYIALELFRGKLRFVSNSDGITNNPPLEIIYGENYADGKYHQVNIEIGEYTKMYTYTYPFEESNLTEVRSTAKDLRFDLDEISYYAGMPIKERTTSKNILLSTRNFEGCLDFISFNGQLALSETSFMQNPGLSFHGKYIKDCQAMTTTFIKSFSRHDEILQASSSVNSRTFFLEFYYKTYIQNGVIFTSVSSQYKSSITLAVRQNKLELRVSTNFNKTSIVLSHHNPFSDDGVWRKIKIKVVPDSVSLYVDDQYIVNSFNKTLSFRFPRTLRFGGFYHSLPGFIGCIKDIFFGKDRVSINKILQLRINMDFEERMCKMKDHCFPNRPCRNQGVCKQDSTKSQCLCDGTGFSGPTCETQGHTNSNIRKSCEAYYRAGYRYDGYYKIKPGPSPPFTVKCKMSHPSGPLAIIETNLSNETFALTGNDFDKEFYYHQVSYQASKRQINDLIAASNSCRQYVRYNCYQSTLLNSKSRPRQVSKFGVRWYTRFGSLRNYWGGNINNSNSCKCDAKKECAQENLSCNCDVMDARMRYDDGYVTELGDLPISKIRVSRLMTNHRSSFELGPLECRVNISSDPNPLFIRRHTSPSLHKSPSTISTIVQFRGPFSTPHNMAVDGPLDNNRGQNQNTTLTEPKVHNTKFIVLDSKLLYVVIAIMIALIIMCMLLLVFRRHVCCCYHENRAKPQIIELYKEEINRNNNANILQVSNDVTVRVDDLMLPFSRAQNSYNNQSSSESSASTTDLERCYYSPEKDQDSCGSKTSKKGDDSPPRRSILKIKKDHSHRHKKSRDNNILRNSDDSTNSIGKFDDPGIGYRKNLDSYSDKDFNYDLDNRDKCPAISPLKQKVLELSTNSSKQPPSNNSRNSLYYNQDSLSSARTSSCSSSNDSDTLGDCEEKGELTFNHDLLPTLISSRDRGKIVRFSDEDCDLQLSRHYRSKNSLLTVDLAETESFLYNEDQNKTLV